MSKLNKSLIWVGFLMVVCIVGTGVSNPFLYQGSYGSDEYKIRKTINSYFNWRYEGLKSSEPLLDIPSFIDNKDIRTKDWFDKERDKRDVELFIYNTYGVKILEYRFHLDFLAISIRQNQAIVDMLENSEITYEDNPDQLSATANIEHRITLIKENDGWTIINDEYTDDFTRLLNVLDKSQVLKNIENNHNQIDLDATSPNLNIPVAKTSATTNGKRLFGYNNSAAKTYADNYYNSIGPVPSTVMNTAGWNSSWPTNYKDDIDRDCTNFVSQAVFEGVSYTASDENYFYPDPSNYEDWWYYKFSTTVDGSKPWMRTGEFYEFLTLNYYFYDNYPEYTIRGPIGHGIDLCYIKTGDVIFMYASGDWQHTVIVDNVGSNTCGGNNVYVAAHDVNSYQRPLSQYSGYNWYPVKIDGFLDEAYTVYLPTALKGVSSLAKSVLGNPYPSPVEDSQQQLDTLFYPYPNP